MCPRAPSPDFGPKGCYIGPEENWEQGGFCPSSHLRLWEKITSQAARSQPGKPAAPLWPGWVAATPHAWKQLRVCGTSSQSGEDPAAEDAVVDKRPGVSWSTRGRHRGAGKGDQASESKHLRAQARGAAGTLPEASPAVLSPEGSWAATPSREGRGWSCCAPTDPCPPPPSHFLHHKHPGWEGVGPCGTRKVRLPKATG